MEPTEYKRPLVEGVADNLILVGRLKAEGTRWRFEQERDEKLFQHAWFESYRGFCQRSLRVMRENFLARLEGVCVGYVARYGEEVPA